MSSNNDGKVVDNAATTMTLPTSFTTAISTSESPTGYISTAVSLNIGISAASNVVQNTSNLSKKTIFNTSEQSIQPESQLNLDGSNSSIMPGSENEQKSETKTPSTEELQPSLDTGKIKPYIKLIL